MEAKYLVLWIEDDLHSMDRFRQDAKLEGITLEGYESAEAGKEVLSREISRFDAVLLDARFFLEKGQVAGTEDLKGLMEMEKHIISLQATKILPRFILTGHADFENDGTFKELFPKHYRKYSQSDCIRLFKDIKAEVDSTEERKIQVQFPRVFELCNESYLRRDAMQPLLDILKGVVGLDQNLNYKLYFNPLRKILELMFRLCHRRNLLPDICFDPHGGVNLDACSKILAGQDVEYLSFQARTPIFTKVVSTSVRRILNPVQGLSHTSSNEAKVNLDQHLATVQSPYLLYSLTFELLDVLLWLRDFLDHKAETWLRENPREKEEKLEFDDGWIHGFVFNVHERGFGFFQPDVTGERIFIPPNVVTDNELRPRMKIKVTLGDGMKGIEVKELVKID